MNRKWVLLAGIALAAVVVIAIFAQNSGSNQSVQTAEKPLESSKENQPEKEESGPQIKSAAVNSETVDLYGKLELTIDLNAKYENPYDPTQLDLFADFKSPSGKAWKINGFYDGQQWKLRFSPDEAGDWTYKLHVKDMQGQAEGQDGSFAAAANASGSASAAHGWIQTSTANKRFLEYRDGTSYYGVGVAYSWGATEANLDKIAQNGGDLITYWNGNYDNAGSGGGNEQLESAASGIGVYDMQKAQRIDELLGQFEQRNLHMSFSIWPHDSLADQLKNWPAQWKKSAYSSLGEAVDFYGNEQMWSYQEKLYRYMIARWGYSRGLGIWDLVVEINGTDGWAHGDQSKANAWIAKMQRYFKENDPYGHPTMGSMAGGASDYWDEGYRTLDLSDRENYYDLHFSAYAEDIQKRWKAYEKPLMTGETGNVSDVGVYHNAMWVSLANGLASSPIWWAFDKVNDDMFGQMKNFSAFVSGIDFAEHREPVEAVTKSFEKKLPAVSMLEDGADVSDWSLPDWADANKDGSGTIGEAALEGKGGGVAATAPMTFATGAYSQGVLQQIPPLTDWSAYDSLSFEVYVEKGSVSGLMAKPVLMPAGEWTEATDANGIRLRPGAWTKIQVPLTNAPSGYWKDRDINAEGLANIAQWAVKVYTSTSSASAKPTAVKIRAPRLTSKKAPVITLKEAEAWVMKGEKLSYGWIVTEQGNAGGKTADIPDWGSSGAVVTWYDPWDGKALGETKAVNQGGSLRITVPETERRDIAFTLHN